MEIDVVEPFGVSVSVPSVPAAVGVALSAGVPGASAYQVAVANGFVGTEPQWLASLAGAPGPAGVTVISQAGYAALTDKSGVYVVTAS